MLNQATTHDYHHSLLTSIVTYVVFDTNLD